MDVSNILKSDTSNTSARQPDASEERAEPGAGEGPSLSPVERIRAFREGTLQFPDINTGTESADEPDHHCDTTDPDETDDSGQARQTDNDPDENSTADDEHPESSAHSPALSWLKSKRAALAVAGILLIAGVVASDIAAHDKTGNNTGKQDAYTRATSRATATTTLSAADKPITPVSADVSPNQCVIGSTPPMDAFDTKNSGSGQAGRRNTAWVCQTAFGAPATIMTITLPTMTTVSEIASVPGFDGKDEDGKDNWPRYRLVKSAIWYFDDDPPKKQEFTTKREQQAVKFDNPIYTKTIRLVVVETTAAPRNQVSSPTTTPSAPGLLGSLGDWGKALGGDGAGPLTPDPTATSAPSGPSAFAMSSQVIGHPSR